MVDVAQLVRASDCGSEGRGFEPLLPPLNVRSEVKTSLFLLYIVFGLQALTAGKLLAAHPQVGIVDKYLDLWIIPQLWIERADKPIGHPFVALFDGVVVAEEIDAQVFKVRFGQSYVADDAVALLPACAT